MPGRTSILRNGVPKECSGWLRSGRLGKRRYFRLRGIMLMKFKSPDDELDWSCSMLNCDILVHSEKWRIHIPKWRLLFAAETKESYEMWVKALMYASRRVISNHYELHEKIGAGTSAEVYRGTCRDTGVGVAIKVVEKQGLSSERLCRLQSEAAIMVAVRSPQIVSTLDIFDEEERVYVVMEHLTGGSLDEIVNKKFPLTEEELRMLMTEIVYGLAALHAVRIAHRDIKLENIVCSFNSFPLGTKLVDFGFGAIIPDSDDSSAALNTMLGTWNYLTPEQASLKPYGIPVDMWAAGVVMYRCATGKFPFMADSPNKLMRMIRNSSVQYGDDWNAYSPRARDFISRLLEPDAEVRMTAVEALAHPFICGEERTLSLVNEDPIQEQLRNIQEMVRAAKAMFRVGTLGAAGQDGRDNNGRDKDGRLTSDESTGRSAEVSQASTSPSSLVTDRAQLKQKKPMGGMLMVGLGKSFTPPQSGLSNTTPSAISPVGWASLEEVPVVCPTPMPVPDHRLRRGKLIVEKNFDCEDQFTNEGDWI